MAIYHFEAKIFSRKDWKSIVEVSAYRSGEKLWCERTGKVYDYSKRRDVLFKRIMRPITAPALLSDREHLWNMVDLHEKRKDAQFAREFMGALPCELNLQQNIKLLYGFLKQQCVEQGMVVDVAIHGPRKGGDERNMHFHCLATTRSVSKEGFGDKVREWNAKSMIYQWREAWEVHVNRALEKAGLECRVDRRSHKERGLDREPRVHLGYQAMALVRRRAQLARNDKNRATNARDAAGEPSTTGSALTIGAPKTHPQNRNDLACLDRVGPDEIDVAWEEVRRIQSLLVNLNQPHDRQAFPLPRCKAALENSHVAFRSWLTEIQQRIDNAANDKTQARWQLQKDLESAKFKENYNQLRAHILEVEDFDDNESEISACRHRARVSGREYRNCLAAWNFRAVRDTEYVPPDSHAAAWVNETRAAEFERWYQLAVRVKKHNWNASRIEKESTHLQNRLDHELSLALGWETSMSMGK